jgi:EAL domain-containing protein (putative c-di-GMP-specific phosphodiesterase class I)
VNILKVDRSFVGRMAIDEESLGIVETILTLASQPKMSVVAEGIETKEQNEQLRQFGCEYGQGFLFSKTLAASEAECYMEAQWESLTKAGRVSEPYFQDSPSSQSLGLRDVTFRSCQN